jgi:L-fuculose-phosphate aldolase
MAKQWNRAGLERQIKEEICEIGRRVYAKGFAAANDGNISYRIAENEVICSPTMICKGFMTPDDICMVDMEGKQLAGKRKRTSEILLHLSIMKARPDVKAVVHCHPPHATAFAVAREPIPQCILPEIEVFIGEVPFAPYETPGGQKFADTVLPFLKPGTNAMILTNHGTVSFGDTLEQAYWRTEIIDAYCRILILARQIGGVTYLNERESRELLDLKKRLGFDDPRFHVDNCDLCGNTAFRDGYKEKMPEPKAFEPPPTYAGYLQPAGSEPHASNPDHEALVAAITDQVLAALSGRR